MVYLSYFWIVFWIVLFRCITELKNTSWMCPVLLIVVLCMTPSGHLMPDANLQLLCKSQGNSEHQKIAFEYYFAYKKNSRKISHLHITFVKGNILLLRVLGPKFCGCSISLRFSRSILCVYLNVDFLSPSPVSFPPYVATLSSYLYVAL